MNNIYKRLERKKRRESRLLVATQLVASTLLLIQASAFVCASTGSNSPTSNQSSARTKPSALSGGNALATTASSEQSDSHATAPISMNLIPVDQPLGRGALSKPSELAAAAAISSRSSQATEGVEIQRAPLTNHEPASLHFSLSDSLEPASGPIQAAQSVDLAADSFAADQQQQEQLENSQLGGEKQARQKVYLEESPEKRQQQQQEELVENAFEGFMNESPAVEQQQQQQQVKFQQQQQMLERRFGFFKKGNHYSAAPQISSPSANYAAANPFMSDCERCLMSIGQQNADYQQLPEPLPSPQPAPVTPILPAPVQPHAQPAFQSAGQPFGFPLKNKLFMKFPFFMKPFGDSMAPPSFAHDSVPYWHQYAQPAPAPPSRPPTQSAALFLRPVAPAYNCIQTSPPLLAAASSGHEVALAATKSQQQREKPYATHQQTTYSSSQY